MRERERYGTDPAERGTNQLAVPTRRAGVCMHEVAMHREKAETASAGGLMACMHAEINNTYEAWKPHVLMGEYALAPAVPLSINSSPVTTSNVHVLPRSYYKLKPALRPTVLPGNGLTSKIQSTVSIIILQCVLPSANFFKSTKLTTCSMTHHH